MKYSTANYQETVDFGRQIGRLLKAGDVILLDGDLGAGKTTLTKGLAQGLDIKRPVKSPTFTLIREYHKGRLPLYHMDMYRLEGTSSADELGLEEYFEGDGVSVVEWSQFIKGLLPEDYLRIKIKRIDDNRRSFEITGQGSHYDDLINNLKNELQ